MHHSHAMMKPEKSCSCSLHVGQLTVYKHTDMRSSYSCDDVKDCNSFCTNLVITEGEVHHAIMAFFFSSHLQKQNVSREQRTAIFLHIMVARQEKNESQLKLAIICFNKDPIFLQQIGSNVFRRFHL
ncbi:uncharacterized protein CEXT_68661 [Caerostris extrusa]|uniref:Uncharacterized protein n=1 Tax=Caerostris extrusa TaxID=172846 RepID=A0AAV4UI51_CAEEX|nr:uncharacterized protein CEXT_68661 [Caerostris extrusa]